MPLRNGQFKTDPRIDDVDKIGFFVCGGLENVTPVDSVVLQERSYRDRTKIAGPVKLEYLRYGGSVLPVVEQ